MIKTIAEEYNKLLLNKELKQDNVDQTLALLEGYANGEFQDILESKGITEIWIEILKEVETFIEEQEKIDIFLDKGKIYTTDGFSSKTSNFTFLEKVPTILKICPVDEYYNLILLYFSTKNRAENLALYCHMDK